MSIKRTIRLMTLGTCLIAGASLGCGGSGTNNDQGTSFLAYGYFTDAEETEGLAGINTYLAVDNNSTDGLNDDLGPAEGRLTFAFLGMQNRLSSQFIRVVRIDCRYEVPGADPLLRIPDDSTNTGLVIPANGAISVTPGDPVAGEGSTGVIGFPIVGHDIYSFLNVNRNLLPALPFRMLASCAGVGVTQAGDVFVTNELPLPISFFDANECCTGAGAQGLGGFQIGTGNGGTPNTFTPESGELGNIGASTGTEATGTTGSTGSTGTSGTGDGTIGS